MHEVPIYITGRWGGSIGRASDLRSKDPRFKPRQEHKTKIVFLSQKCADSLSVCLYACVYARIRMDHVSWYAR